MRLTMAASGHLSSFEPDELISGEVSQIDTEGNVLIPGGCGRIDLRSLSVGGNLNIASGTELIVHGEIFIGGKTQCADRASVSKCDGCQRCKRD